MSLSDKYFYLLKEKYPQALTCGYRYFFSPGRLEIIGNHEDYNGGLTIACPASLGLFSAVKPNESNVINLYSDGFPEEHFSLEDKPTSVASQVIKILKDKGYKVSGFDIYIVGDLPVGSGLSSSASFENLISLSVSYLFNDGQIPVIDLATAGMLSERTILHKGSGLLDQKASLADGLTLFDFKTGRDRLLGKTLPFKMGLFITNAGHQDLSHLYQDIVNDYNDIKNYFKVINLSDIHLKDLLENKDKFSEKAFNRGLHFFTSYERVLFFIEAYKENDLDSMILLFNQEEESQEKYLKNIANPTFNNGITDILTSFRKYFSSSGIRLIGGGFGGSLLCLFKEIDEDKIERFKEETKDYGSFNLLDDFEIKQKEQFLPSSLVAKEK